uniref:Glucose-6-phosphate isomerase n=1 Tax=Amphora coffeiformis TaxID=265554 RepID=A0A7S3LEX2_9STRA
MSMRHSSAEPSSAWTLKCTDLPQFDALQAQADLFRSDDKLHLRNLCNDTARSAGLTAVHMTSYQRNQRKIILDYSRQRVLGETMELLFDLADAVGLTDRREAFRIGHRINLTENRAVLHHLLRIPDDENVGEDSFSFSGTPVLSTRSSKSRRNVPAGMEYLLPELSESRKKVENFSEQVRHGIYKSVNHLPFRNTLVVAQGGFYLGPQFVATALHEEKTAHAAAEGRTIRFLNNIDPTTFTKAISQLDAAETLVVIIDKNFDSADTMLNARTIRTWMIQKLEVGGITDKEIVSKHFIAVSCSSTRCRTFGIRPENIFEIHDWVNPRYSLCSVAGLLPLALHFSYAVVEAIINGSHDMDQHFFDAPLRDNIPVILGLLGVWNSTFLGYSTRAILPYSEGLAHFSGMVQHIDMESNGKRVALDGTPLLHRSGEVNFGGCAATLQHSFFQLLHQGRVVPVDFIGLMESQQPNLPGEVDQAASNHDELMSHFFAQPDALAYGKTLMDLIQEGAPDPLREHMVVTGNRPSSSILITKLDAYAVGQLLALYEHRTAVQGFMWGINSFDQFGCELGKTMARHVRAQLSASRKTGASVQGFNSSTSSLLEHYLAHGKGNDSS